MDIAINTAEHDVVTVTLNHRIDAFSAPSLRDQLHEIIEAGSNRLVIDLSGTPFMDSAGMSVLVAILKRVRPLGGDVKLVWPDLEAARRIISLTRFDKVFKMAETATEAQAGSW